MKYPISASRLKQILEVRNMSQQELADKSGVGKSSISHYINGSNEPGNKSAYLMSKVLKVNPMWLMGLDVPMEEITQVDTDKLTASQLPDLDEETLNRLQLAMELYEKYRNAIPEVQAAVETLLKSSKPHS